VRSLPGPDDPVWDDDPYTLDVGELVPEDVPDTPDAPVPPLTDQPEDVRPAAPDPPPAHGKRQWRKAPPGPKAKPIRVTAGIARDINAKISFALQVPGTIWQARDPLCGGVFVEQIPETAEAFTDIICDSPDLVAFFTGPGGNFMKVLKLGAALMPVVQVVAAHHVYHSIEIGEPDPQQPQQSYAA
jgi:hypothetical protein